MKRRMKIAAAASAAMTLALLGSWTLLPDGGATSGPWRAFDDAWFARHQPALLRLVNESALRDLARAELRLDDIPGKIAALGPNRVTYGVHRLPDGRTEATTRFYTAGRLAKRVYRLGKPLWWAEHAADLALDRWLPSQSFGLSTLSAFSSTADGHVFLHVVNNGTWAFIHDSQSAGGNISAGATSFKAGLNSSSTSNWFTDLFRAEVQFDTSSLTAAASISAVTLSVYGSSASNSFTNDTATLNVYTFSPATPGSIVVTDYIYTSWGTTALSTGIASGAFSTSSYNNFVLNATGRAAVDPAGTTALGLRLTWDANNVSPTWQASKVAAFTMFAAEQTGTTQDPLLTVTFSTYHALNLAGN